MLSPRNAYPKHQGWGCVMFTLLLVLCSGASPADEVMLDITSLKEIREAGVVMQKWETSCAAATLATVLTYGFHDPVSEQEVAAAMLEGTKPEKVRAQGGFTLLDMRNFVVARGYGGGAYKGLGLEELAVLHAPIVPIDAHGYNHYVVFNGVQDDHVLLADPAFGNRRVSKVRFERLWLGGMAFVISGAPQ